MSAGSGVREPRRGPPEVHPTAVVSARAELAAGVLIGPHAVIGPDVVIGPGTRVGPHVVIEEGVRLGADNTISVGATLGTTPQDRHFGGERSYLVIGERNSIREYVNLSRATGEEAATVIGNETTIMAFAHIGHNCRLGDRVIIVNGCQVAGHVHIADDAYVGGMTGVHQFVHIGRLAMIGGFSIMRQDCPPFMLAEGRPARCRGLNRVGLRRAGVDAESLVVLRRAFRLLYQSALPRTEAIRLLRAELGTHPLVADILDFLRAPRERARGILRWAGAMPE